MMLLTKLYNIEEYTEKLQKRTDNAEDMENRMHISEFSAKTVDHRADGICNTSEKEKGRSRKAQRISNRLP